MNKFQPISFIDKNAKQTDWNQCSLVLGIIIFSDLGNANFAYPVDKEEFIQEPKLNEWLIRDPENKKWITPH